MTYIFTQLDRLEKPINYMYSEFTGQKLLSDYRADRLSLIIEISNKLDICQCSPEAEVYLLNDWLLKYKKNYDIFIGLFLNKFDLENSNFNLSVMIDLAPTSYECTKVSQETVSHEGLDTEKFFRSLLDQNDVALEDCDIKLIDTFLKKFEVTKKLYAFYKPGFGKGYGENQNLNLYFLFSILMVRAYCFSKNLKYLNALLKINDLIISVSRKGDNLNFLASCNYQIILIIELFFVSELAIKQGLTFE